MHLVSKFWRNTDGNISTLFALALAPMLAATGAGIDYGRMSGNRTRIQAALDSAVLAGVVAPSKDQDATARTVFHANASSGIKVTAQSYTPGTDTLRGDVTVEIPMFFGFLFDKKVQTVAVTATAKVATTTVAAPPDPPKPASGACILLLDQMGSQALLVNSGAQFIAPDCEVHVKSTASPAAMFNAGTSLDAKKFCIEGKDVTQNSTSTKNLELGCKTASDPFASAYPAPSTNCTVSNQNYSGTVTLNPGVYCGWFNFNGSTNVTFAPGVYVIKSGGWNVSGGSFKGSGVTFYFADTSKIQFNSGMDTDLTPPTSGSLKGVLFYEAAGLPKSDFIFNNAVKNRMEGLIYLPSRNVTFNADSKLGSDKATLVFHRLIWNNVKMGLAPNADVLIPVAGAASSGTATGTSGGGTTTKKPVLIY